MQCLPPAPVRTGQAADWAARRKPEAQGRLSSGILQLRHQNWDKKKKMEWQIPIIQTQNHLKVIFHHTAAGCIRRKTIDSKCQISAQAEQQIWSQIQINSCKIIQKSDTETTMTSRKHSSSLSDTAELVQITWKHTPELKRNRKADSWWTYSKKSSSK